MAYLDSSNVEDLVADIKALADQTYLPINTKFGVLAVETDALIGVMTNANALATSNSKITSDMIPIDIAFDKPASVLKNVTVNPIDGNIKITGAFGNGNIGVVATIYLMKPMT